MFKLIERLLKPGEPAEVHWSKELTEEERMFLKHASIYLHRDQMETFVTVEKNWRRLSRTRTASTMARRKDEK